MRKINLALIGATGMVGRTALRVLEERSMQVNNFYAFGSKRSAGETVTLFDKEYVCEELSESSFERDIDIAIFCAGGEVSAKYAKAAVRSGCIVVDNSSHFRMDADVALVVPEVNPHAVKMHKGIIANPNCSTIQAVVALKPLQDKYGLRRVIYSTYQSVSGAGLSGINALKDEIFGVFSRPIAHNLIPQIDSFLDNGYTKEEMKMIDETKKILEQNDLGVSATTVRVPVFYGHSEAINIELASPFELAEVKELLSNAPGITLMDDIEAGVFPTPIDAEGKDEVLIGRVRRDESVENGLNIFCVADNIRKGAATNAVQIVELLIKGEF